MATSLPVLGSLFIDKGELGEVNFDGTGFKNTMVMIDNHTLSEKKHMIDTYKSDLTPL